MHHFLLLLLLVTGLVAGDDNSVQVVGPMSLNESAKWDMYLEVVKIKDVKDSSTLIDTRNAKNTTMLVHSYSVVESNGFPYVVIAYMRPKADLRQLATDLTTVEMFEERLKIEIQAYKEQLIKQRSDLNK